MLSATHLVFLYGVDAQLVESIALGLLAALLPLLLLGARQVGRRVDVARLPLAVYLALELAPPLRLDHLARLCGAVEASFSGEAGGQGAAEGLARGRAAGCAAVTEYGEEAFIWESFSRRRGGGAEAWATYPASAGPTRSIAGMSATRRRRV
jgi:hypothetical protein